MNTKLNTRDEQRPRKAMIQHRGDIGRCLIGALLYKRRHRPILYFTWLLTASRLWFNAPYTVNQKPADTFEQIEAIL
jgi:hypothetical protein